MKETNLEWAKRMRKKQEEEKKWCFFEEYKSYQTGNIITVEHHKETNKTRYLVHSKKSGTTYVRYSREGI